MVLQTPRLILRNFIEADIEPLLTYRNIPEVAIYQGWQMPYPRESAEKLIVEMQSMESPVVGQWFQMAITLGDTGEMIGDVGMHIIRNDPRQARIGYTIAPKHWRKGYATEVILSMLGFLFDALDLHRVSADCDVENTGSWRALEKAGFRREAHFVESYPMGGYYSSEYVYAILQREWRAGKNFSAGHVA